MSRRTLGPLAGAALLLATAACATSESSEPPGEASLSAEGGATGGDHGAVEGAQEVGEPQLRLVTVDAEGAVGMLDLLDGTVTELGEIGPPSATTTDGRYLFATTSAGVEVVDSGMWTWDHGDHSHYYRGTPSLLGTVDGSGPVTIATGSLSTAGGTGIFFPETGEAVLLDNEALADGEVTESFRIRTRPHDGLVAPLGDGALVTVADGSGRSSGSGAVTSVRFHTSDGDPLPRSEASCTDARGTITTAVGVVIGCADGALLATYDGDRPVFERIPYPEKVEAPRATAFRNREGRPTVAALAGPRGIWLLDTRKRTWQHLESDVPLLRASASDDEEGHLLALDRAGRVRVYAAGSGRQLAVTRPLLDQTLLDPGLLAGVELVVDQTRAYLNAPAEGAVYEIDYADSARIARRLTTPTRPVFFAEAGR